MGHLEYQDVLSPTSEFMFLQFYQDLLDYSMLMSMLMTEFLLIS